MAIAKEVELGQAVYSKTVLRLYDLWVLGLSNRFIWQCPTPRLLAHFNKHISANHLDVGVGTGYFLNRCHFPSTAIRLGLMDLNRNSLEVTAARVARYRPLQFHCNVLDEIHVVTDKFDTISLNYLFHCLPGKLTEKLSAMDHVCALLSDSGTVFGSTILSKGVHKNTMAKKLMAIYNKKGILSNAEDCKEDLETYLASRFNKYFIGIQGCVALFSAKDRR
ncbi:class I SAM-dependent methyltransferase [Microbulbifer spongiae]|uniref:Class I SAM-dependent methyltransferase n=1 Tax=Microbulbifer spongiae TaxID=2944933 RepID=A0ABY9EBE0_9GAMM|nr:class I SAM-dependent methyltransferase [Microbulbifer sp. MI-G]WKD50295.1 class I SAM-dependent methyltransferase [Microbulbifer sp. MI-G]